MELERSTHLDQPHAFQSGKSVTVFSNASGKPQKENVNGVINYVRDNAGLSPVTATTADDVQEKLLHERFAQMFLEAHRMVDLHRFGLVGEVLGTGRPTKFPLESGEIQLNSHVNGQLAGRCLPMS